MELAAGGANLAQMSEMRAFQRATALQRLRSDHSCVLFRAAMAPAPTAIRRVIAAGADVDAMNISGVTAAMVAAGNGNHHVLAMLIDAGAPLEDVDKKGRTALLAAAELGF